MKSEWITYKGKQIIYADCSGLRMDAQAVEAELDAVDDLILQQAEGSVLCLLDVRDTVGSSEVLEAFKKSSSRTRAHVRKTAVVGVSGLRRLLADAVARFSGEPLTYFEDVEAAKEWLITD